MPRRNQVPEMECFPFYEDGAVEVRADGLFRTDHQQPLRRNYRPRELGPRAPLKALLARSGWRRWQVMLRYADLLPCDKHEISDQAAKSVLKCSLAHV